jgi:hypothetical protein
MDDNIRDILRQLKDIEKKIDEVKILYSLKNLDYKEARIKMEVYHAKHASLLAKLPLEEREKYFLKQSSNYDL